MTTNADRIEALIDHLDHIREDVEELDSYRVHGDWTLAAQRVLLDAVCALDARCIAIETALERLYEKGD